MLKIHLEDVQKCLFLPVKPCGVVLLHPELLLGFHEEMLLAHNLGRSFRCIEDAFTYLH